VILGIDASNIRAGGGVTHLSQILRAADPRAEGFSKVIVWASRCTIERMPKQRPWLSFMHESLLDKSLAHRLHWQRTKLPRIAQNSCHLVFFPGSRGLNNCLPYVTLSQNILPFEYQEVMRYGLSWTLARLLMLRFSQGRAFRNANGVIFLSSYACSEVTRKAGILKGQKTIIPHGIERRFFRSPRPQRPMAHYSQSNPFRLLYVSVVDLYKHQWLIARAAADLRNQNWPVKVDFVGPAYAPALRRLEKTIRTFDPEGRFLHYRGPVLNKELHRHYHLADGFVFASSCENFPIILLEAMAAGLPIACSNRGPMPEVLGNGGIYFDPENLNEVTTSLARLLEDHNSREKFANRTYERAQAYTWERCASETFDFLAKVALSS
jgi:glycosyltransferase involved in cell wall biosynthesis